MPTHPLPTPIQPSRRPSTQDTARSTRRTRPPSDSVHTTHAGSYHKRLLQCTHELAIISIPCRGRPQSNKQLFWGPSETRRPPPLVPTPQGPPKMRGASKMLAQGVFAAVLLSVHAAPHRFPRQATRCSGDGGGDGTCIDACGHYQPSGCWVKTGTKMRLLTLRYLG